MKICTALLFLLLVAAPGWAQQQELSLGNTRFRAVKQVKPNDSGSKDTLVTLYRLGIGKPVLVLSHTIYSYGADCNNAVTERSSMHIEGDSLIFTTRISQKTGLDPIPCLQREAYVPNNKGTLRKVYDAVKYEGSGPWLPAKP